MSNKRITELTELTTPTTDDVFPVVDIATNTTTKVQLGNLPVPTSVTTALATKENTITPGTTAQYYRGDKSFQTLDKTAVGLSNVDNTSDANKPVSTATQTALNAKQDTLVSGTNIKTLNSTSLLGSGNIVLTANPSGVSGAIQFSNGSAFASDAANLFWDDTNNRLGVGTNAPSHALTIDANTTDDGLIMRGPTDTVIFQITKDGNTLNSSELFQYNAGVINFALRSPGNASYFNNGTFTFGANTNLGAKVNIKGSGSTSATTSLLVQNSAGTDAFRVRDDGGILMGFGSGSVFICDAGGPDKIRATNVGVGIEGSPVTSAALAVNGTSKGLLPPRMTTTQKNNISSPAAGLVVYDTTTNKLCCYNGSTWNDLF